MGNSNNKNNNKNNIVEKAPVENNNAKLLTVPVKDTSEDVEDPVELMLKKTGCLEKHYGVQECIAESRDWRQCQKQVQDFRACMLEHQKRAKLDKTDESSS